MKEINLVEKFGYHVTNETLNAAGFYKVSETCGSLVIATYYNPETDEEDGIVARDYDYDRSVDNDSVYNAVINENVKKVWLHSNGAILEGDKVMVIKGRKVPKGTVHTVKAKKDVYDRYGRWQCEYLIFDDGLATNEANCIRVLETENIA